MLHPLLSNHYSVILSHFWFAAKESRAWMVNLSNVRCQIQKLQVCRLHHNKTKEKQSSIFRSRPPLTVAFGNSTEAEPEIENEALTSSWSHHCHQKVCLTPSPKVCKPGEQHDRPFGPVLSRICHTPLTVRQCYLSVDRPLRLTRLLQVAWGLLSGTGSQKWPE